MTSINLYYVDDSGDARTCLTLTALEVPAAAWRGTLRAWLGWRKTMYKHHALATLHELHGVKFITGRGQPAPARHGNPPINHSTDLRRKLYEQSLAQIGRTETIRAFTIYRGDIDKAAIYADLLAWIESELALADACGFLVVDGLDAGFYRPLHRSLKLKTRLVLEDAWMKDSRHCQFVQMADLAGYSAYQSIARKEDRRFMWDWYERLVAPTAADPRNGHASRIKGHP